jgi:hypothetical protein
MMLALQNRPSFLQSNHWSLELTAISKGITTIRIEIYLGADL